LTTLNEVGRVVDVLPVRATTDLVAVNEVGRPIDVPLATIEAGLIATNEVGGAVSVAPVRIVTDPFVPDAAGRLVFSQPLRGLAVSNPPVNTALPVISQTGSVLSVTTGTWTGTAPITHAYQFTRNGTPVSAPSASQNYTIPDADLNALFGCIVTGTNSAGNASAAAALLYVGVMDVLSVQPAANYELRRESRSYTGLNARVRRSSDNAEANFDFATAAQTRTNLAAIPINNNGGSTAPGVTMTVTGTGTEFGQPYVEVRWQGTASAADFLQFNHSAVGAFNSAIHAPVTPGLTYTTSIGFMLVSGTAPSGALFVRGKQCNNVGSFIGGTGVSLGPVTSTLQRGAVNVVALANAAFIQPNIYMSVNNGEVVDVTIRFYAANVELGVGNARPLLQRNVPETIADIGELDAEALLSFVGNGNGFITILHDKSGNGRNATQTTPAAQPQIVANGAIITRGGRPAISVDGLTQFLNLPTSGAPTQNSSLIGVFQTTNSVFGAAGFINIANGAADPEIRLGVGTGGSTTTYRAYWNGAYVTIDNPAVNFQNRSVFNVSFAASGGVTANTVRVNGSEALSASRGGTWTGASEFTIGRYIIPNVMRAGIAQGLIIIQSVPSTADRQLIERNRGAYYGIPVS
jgi:hypothetical protein